LRFFNVLPRRFVDRLRPPIAWRLRCLLRDRRDLLFLSAGAAKKMRTQVARNA